MLARPGNDAGQCKGSPHFRYRINRRQMADVRLTGPRISKHHGGVDYREGKWWVNDGGSVEPVTVNGEPLEGLGERVISSGDVLGFGDTTLAFETDGGPPASPESSE